MCFKIFDIICDVNIAVTLSSMQMKLNRLIVQQNKIYSSKLE